MSARITLGVHIGHDAAAAIFVAGQLAYAEEEERFSGEKAHKGCPWRSIDAALERVGAAPEEVDTLALSWDLPAYLACRRQLADGARRSGNVAWSDKRHRQMGLLTEGLGALRRLLPRAEVVEFAHHLCHLACAVYLGPPEAGSRGGALGVVVDALGDASSATVFGGPDAATLLGAPEVLRRVGPRGSVGFLYKRAAEALGFAGQEACGSLMALAGCGEDESLVPRLRALVLRPGEGGALRLVREQLDPFLGSGDSAWRSFGPEVRELLGLPGRPEEVAGMATQARAVQVVTEEYLEALVGEAIHATGARTLFVSGGVALNCVALARLARRFAEVELVACGVKRDSGTALGAAVLAEVARGGLEGMAPRRRDLRLGTVITGEEAAWGRAGADQRLEDPDRRAEVLVDALEEGDVVALVEGAGEFGPRALGARSLLASPGRPELADRINRDIKRRHGFQPFAGAFLEGELQRRVPGVVADRFMSYAVAFSGASREGLEGILHRDGTTRAQVVPHGESTMLARVLRERARRGLPGVVLNTSLNARGCPIARTAEDVLATCADLGVRTVSHPRGVWLAP